MKNRRLLLLAGMVALLAEITAHPACAQPAPSGPAYQIVLRSRHAEATPIRTTRDGQTGGGSIVVEQADPNTIVVTMGGAVVVGSDLCASTAGITFNLEQDLDIVPTRKGLRPPRVGIVGRVVGTLQVTDRCKCLKCAGSAEQGPAFGCLEIGGHSLLSVNVQPSVASCGQESSINFRDGPVEAVAAPGPYRLTGSFRIVASQGKGVWNRQFAVADFDPAPQLDAFWADALKPFRAVPRRDFGFKIVVRVIEDTPALATEEKGN
jgi:hypothetical protein